MRRRRVMSLRAQSVQFSSIVQSCPTLCDPMDCSNPGFPVHYQLPEHAQTHVHWVSDAIQPSHPLLFPSSLAFNLSQHQGLFQQHQGPFTSGGQSIGGFSFSDSPSNEYSGLISFRINWFDIFAAWKTLKSLLQHFGSWNYLLVYVSPTQVVGLNYFASLLLLSISLWFLLYIFCCGRAFFLNRGLSHW